jgi:hypothetical protein
MIYKGPTSKSVVFAREKGDRLPNLMAVALLSLISLTIKPNYVKAQQIVNDCRPPVPGEYLVLISTPTPESQQLAIARLPKDIDIGLCRYVDRIVARIGQFRDRALADDWRRYVEETLRLPAYVVDPSSTNPQPTGNPGALGAGYAVLVDYSQRPEIAAELQRLLARDIGLVLYGGKNFLLVTYTPNIADAAESLKRVSDRGFFTFLVDSSRVTLLNPRVPLGN